MKKHKKVTIKKRVAIVATSAMVVSSLGAAALAADLQATQVAVRATSTWSPPSSDPSGITFIPGQGLLVSDAEIEESAFTAPITHTNNLFLSDLSGNRIGGGSTVGWSNEPTGVAYAAANANRTARLFVTDDDQKRVYEIDLGADGKWGTSDDVGNSRTFFRTTSFGNNDPEDVALDFHRNELWIAGGLSTIVSRVNPGADGRFDTLGDNVTKNFSLPPVNDPTDPLKVPSPEGIAYDPERQTILVLDGEATRIYEFARNGALLNTIRLDNIDVQSPGGITLDPASTGSSRTYYLADRGLDPNGTRPASCPAGSPATCEPFNDGTIHEIRVTGLPAITNRPPLADAGDTMIADTNETITLLGSGEDGETPGLPNPLSYSWTRVSGPGTVTLGTPNAATTTAVFSQAGDHTMRLTVSDGALTHSDQVVVHVFAPGAPRTVDIPIRSGIDDGQEQIGTTSNGFTDLESADNELGNTNGTAANAVLTGLRFVNMPIPNASTIDSARIQFSVDEINQAGHNTAASYVVAGQRAGNAPPFVHGNAVGAGKFNISSRTPTTATVPWTNVPVWTTVRDEGPAQLTPNLAPILQEIVSLPDWARGNAAVFTIKNAAGNIGRRTAEAIDGRIPPYLRVTYRTPLANVAPIVNAGSNLAVTLPGVASLNGTVTDDGKPNDSVTTTWSKVSGPGTVTFGNASALSTTASFSAAGNYVLRLTANDGALTASSNVNVKVAAADAPPSGGKAVPTLTAETTASTLRTGRVATVSGKIEPASSGQVIKLQQLQGTTWTDLGTRTVQAGATSTARFDVMSRKSAFVRLRMVSPATAVSEETVSNTMTLSFYRMAILRVNHAKDVVKLKNTGAVRVDLGGWVLKNKKNGKSFRLPAFTLRPGKVVKIHSGDGATTARHLFLDGRDIWGKRGKAVLKDLTRKTADKLRY